MRPLRTGLIAGLAAVGLWLWLARDTRTEDDPVARPTARVETAAVPSPGDAADDPAVWIHPTAPDRSLLLGSDKKGALHAYNLDGSPAAGVSPGLRPNNIDLRYDVLLGGKKVDVLAGSVRGSEKGLMLWTIDAETRAITPAVDHAVAVFGGAEPYGMCLYRRARDGALFAFVNNRGGEVEQLRLEDDGRGKFKATRLRGWDVGDTTEACVADDEYGAFYISEESEAIWKYGADPEEPMGKNDRIKIAGTSGKGSFKPDTEGLALYCTGDGDGYLIASSQGNDRFNVYRRTGDHAFLTVINPVEGGGIDDVNDTDGIEVCNAALGAKFPKGLLIVQDGDNSPDRQNFKVYGWEDVAGTLLKIDTAWDPRKPVWRKRQ